MERERGLRDSLLLGGGGTAAVMKGFSGMIRENKDESRRPRRLRGDQRLKLGQELLKPGVLHGRRWRSQMKRDERSVVALRGGRAQEQHDLCEEETPPVEELCDVRPLVAVLGVGLHDDAVLFRCPWGLTDVRIEMVMPPAREHQGV